MVKYLVFIFLAFLFISPDQSSETDVQVAMIYNFMKYTHWPNQGTEFTVAVYGNNDVYTLLSQRYNDKNNGAGVRLKIKNVTDVAELETAQVVYIGKSKDFDKIMTVVANKPILTITYSDNLGRRGSCINMKLVGDRMKFEINQKSVDAAGLKISNQLTSIAILI